MRRTFSILFTLLALSCTRQEPDSAAGPKATVELVRGETLARAHCASCHQYPEPHHLEKWHWEHVVLPKMGPRLGITGMGPTVYKREAENALTRAAKVYPDQPLISEDEWKLIFDFYTTMAPDSQPPPQDRDRIRYGLKHFTVRRPRLSSTPFPMSTLVKFDRDNGKIYVGDARKDEMCSFDTALNLEQRINVDSPPSWLAVKDNELWVTLMGPFVRTSDPTGSLVRIKLDESGAMTNTHRVVADSLLRPVQFRFCELNQDGLEDIVLCEFGSLIGALSWFENLGDGDFRRHVIKNVPGAMVAYTGDYDEDGRTDVFALFSQGDESISILFNLGGGRFQEKRVLRFSPVHGSNYFELVDVNGDGLLDIVHTCGDNGDQSYVMKNYHGVRIFLNQGDYEFALAWFYPVNGAIKAMTRDFDNDGDLDIACISFFPDYVRFPGESFVYFENRGELEFRPRSFRDSYRLGRWLTMEAEDIDDDNDLDIILGSCPVGLTPTPPFLTEQWVKKGRNLIVLNNSTIN